MINYDIRKEKVKHPYTYYGRVFEVEKADTTFAVKTALRYVIDDYDPYLGSVELSHYDELDYNIVFNYNQDDENDTLDLTWMREEDVFDIESNEQNKLIKTLKTNISNIDFSRLATKEDNFHDLDLEIYDNNSPLSIIAKARALKAFLSNNKESLSGNIKLEGFTPITRAILGHYAKEFNFTVKSEENNKIK